MRFSALLLGVGFIATDSVFAGPCKPKSSSSDAIATTSLTSAIESITTDLETSTDISSETTTSEATTTTVVVQTTATTLDDQTTTDMTTTTTAEAESTATTAPAPTFKIVSGGGAVDGALLQGLDEEGHLMMFNPNSTLEDYKPRTFTIEPSTGRVKDKDGGYYICAYYQWTGHVAPATIGGCTSSPGPDARSNYIKCRVVDGKLSCTVPQTVCTRDIFDRLHPLVCVTSTRDEVYDKFYYQTSGDQIVYLSSLTTDSYFAAVDLIAQKA
ncbi:hypothetical protein FMUND_5621 [Fusarium mundagurra]|uniref:Uncharacterized protein n=1 Tax=Fusarium mundagurra TaxID=1567541 RepID=A0A8H6DIC0_9HYPO|nr:hypothetical protein FMUND_5621 [Fusarium mundagurra]